MTTIIVKRTRRVDTLFEEGGFKQLPREFHIKVLQ